MSDELNISLLQWFEQIQTNNQTEPPFENSPIDVAKDLLEHGRLVQHNDLIIIIPMRAGVDDAVHVEVEVVHLAIDVEAVVDALVDIGILIGQPPEHLGDAMEGRGGRRRPSH